MAYINKYDKNGTCSKTGNKAESNFSKLARAKGWQIEETTRRQNMFAHIDFILKKVDFISKIFFITGTFFFFLKIFAISK